MKGYVKIHGQYTGVEPSGSSVYQNRDAGGEWEAVEVTRHNDEFFDARYLAANRQLSMQPDGRLESRPAGAIGLYEQFQIRTEDGTGRHIMYRDDLVGVVLEFEAGA
jgi:hypothetical protein